MNALWITLALLTAGFAGWPVTALVFRLARTIDDKADAAKAAADRAARDRAADEAANDPAADVTVDRAAADRASADREPVDRAGVDGEITVAADVAEGGAGKVPAGAAAPPAPTTRILRGGAIIGVLERLAVCLAILTGQPVAIAYVVAIKGLGRFAELKETPVAAERFIIGTLSSMLWAAGVAALAKILFLS
ncbi:hypothetical protein ASF98_17955 [Arthrobacter sp. Leaf337]|uniref:hypothetical protein n=1 Tax=Arthrobacter sp. Leaf337 TaxID=1736342 RepID=UPI0006FE6DCF|nr:hypothetical protein [Arthrobacter sp. Leaf337]KQR80687.1 hypothetical protein ASF98_17955 [Arthrobacter sp. Leaf337]